MPNPPPLPAQSLPLEERPTIGGRYLRDPLTGALTRLPDHDDPAVAVPAPDQPQE